jgi:hypothetical protein
MEQLTLEQAAVIHANKAINSHRESSRSFTESLNISFQAGAEWQKGQYKRILQLAFNAANELDSLGAVSLCNHIKTELEKLTSL